MKRRLVLVLCSMLILSGCGASESPQEVSQVEVNKESKLEVVSDMSDSTEVIESAWDETFIINDCVYHIGDPISSLQDIDWEYPTDLVPYVSPVPDGNLYIELPVIGTFTYADNESKKACKPEDCIITHLNATGVDNVRKFIPNIPSTLEDVKLFFGKDSITKIVDDYSDITSIDFLVNNYDIHVTVLKDNSGVESLSFDYGAYSDKFRATGIMTEDDISERVDFDSFNIGLSKYTFLDKSKVSNLQSKYIDETDYTTSVSFDYKLDNTIFEVTLKEVTTWGYGLKGLEPYSDNHRDIVVAGNTYTIGNDKSMSYTADDTIICRYKGYIDLEVYTEDMTDELFTKLLEEFETVFAVEDNNNI